MSKITYENKVGVEPKTVAINQWQDVDGNQVKEVVNDNDTCTVVLGYPVQCDKTSAGRRYGSFGTPLTGSIPLSNVDVQEGGCAVVIWSGDANPLILGGTVQSYAGEITKTGVYSFYFHYLNGRYNVNIFNVDGIPPITGIPVSATNLSLLQGTTTPIPVAPTNIQLVESQI